jgi:hypothetical protein
MSRANDEFTRSWIIEKARKVLEGYYEGITVRQLHYRLVADYGMTNDINHYKRVVGAMGKARWDDIVSMDAFIDRERSMYHETRAKEMDVDEEIERGKENIKAWMKHYRLNRWSNQSNYIEVWIEKKALQGVFERPCLMNDVGLCPCKGYPSITFLYEASKRFKQARDNGKTLIVLYFGDYDPSGADIPRNIEASLAKLGVDVTVKRIALNPDLIKELNLPGVPPKLTDSRTRNWDGGSVVELDAVEPKKLTEMCEEAIREHFNKDEHRELKEREAEERVDYQKALKDFVKNIDLDDDEDEEE